MYREKLKTAPDLQRARQNHTRIILVRSHHSSTQERNWGHPYVRRLGTPQPVRQMRMMPIGHKSPDGSQHHSRKHTDIHQNQRKERLLSVPTRQDLTTFITPFRWFKFLRTPYSLSSISKHYNHRMDEAFIGLLGFWCIADDIAIYDQNRAEHVSHVRKFLQRCAEKNITLN